jgi:hypothetical protein
MNLRQALLELLAGGGDHRWGMGRYYLVEDLQKRVPQRLHPRQVMEVLWQLVSDGLVFVDYTQPSPDNWVWVLSERGQRVAASGADYEPDNPEGYLRVLRIRIPEIDEQVFLYVREALGAYAASCYLASSVMLGVASERAFQLLGESFALWLPVE